MHVYKTRANSRKVTKKRMYHVSMLLEWNVKLVGQVVLFENTS